MIFTGINFVTILLFVPETRFPRDEVSAVGPVENVANSSNDEKIAEVDLKSIRQPSHDETDLVPKKSWVQDLKLWSGVPNTNLFKMFIR